MSLALRAPRAPLRDGLRLTPGQRIGLYGGSFDPVHSGHLHVARTALRRLGLDRVVWLVSPGNPLKPTAPESGLAARMAAVRALAPGPDMIVSGVEAAMGARYTLDTVRALQRRHPGVRFVWIMGGDGLAGFHHWRGWREIARRVPIAVVARPGWRLAAGAAPFARAASGRRLAEAQAHGLASAKAPAWVYLTAPLDPASSTQIRARRNR